MSVLIIMEVLDSISIEIGVEEVEERLRIKDHAYIKDLIDLVRSLISPKAIYRIGTIQEKQEGGIIIDGITFTSRLLRKNLDRSEEVFPFIVTIGGSLEEEIKTCGDLLEQFYLDSIGNIALVKVREYLRDYLCSRFAIECLSFMEPGSLRDWPIEEQRALFSVFGGRERLIGVRLTESLLMIPMKSLSGIFFSTEEPFYTCQFCSRERCESRRVSYNKELATRYGVHE